jgi:hypothetical protein
MPVPDNEMKAGIFPGEAIIVEGGKLATKANIEIADPWHYQADHNSSP